MKKLLWISIGAVGIIAVAVMGAIFASPVRTVLASALSGSGGIGFAPWAAWHNGQGGGSGFTLPPALQGLVSIPAGDRFDHFAGVQVELKDQNNQPLTVRLIPGKVTTASATSLSITANDGSAQTFTLNNQTLIHTFASSTAAPTRTPGAQQPASATPVKGDDVIVVTLNNSPTATAVLDGGPAGFQWSGPGGW